jgi:hypothetical protein
MHLTDCCTLPLTHNLRTHPLLEIMHLTLSPQTAVDSLDSLAAAEAKAKLRAKKQHEELVKVCVCVRVCVCVCLCVCAFACASTYIFTCVRA